MATARKTDQQPPKLFKPASVKPREPAAVPSLSSLPVDVEQCKNAVKALVNHANKRRQQQQDSTLLDNGDEKVFLSVGLVKPPRREVHKPVRVTLEHPVIDPRQNPVTLFVKDPQREYKDLLDKLNIKFINRVIGVDKLKTKHKTFEAKRQLLKEADLFLVDDRVMVEVGHCIGKMWRDAKKQPVPIAITRKDLKAELERAVASTYMQISTGTNLSIKIGSLELHDEAQLVANLLSAIPQLAVRIPESPFSNIQSLHIKTSTSTALPIYNARLNDEGVFAGPTQEEIEAKKAAAKEKEKREAEKEERRKERSATKEGKGRVEKKRKAAEDNDAQDEPDATVGENEDFVAENKAADKPKKKAKSDSPKKATKKTKQKV
ncbi:proteasome-interacting protein cic1 [Microbotryomycetes sp. JL201]|nr:proteasome-interacting protein cic1 [Microbotryomycetes sp. JL201]